MEQDLDSTYEDENRQVDEKNHIRNTNQKYRELEESQLQQWKLLDRLRLCKKSKPKRFRVKWPYLGVAIAPLLTIYYACQQSEYMWMLPT